METLKRFIICLMLFAAVRASAQFRANPFTTNGPIGNPILIVGDSLSADGSWQSGGLGGYMTVAAGRGCSWPDWMLSFTNYYFHGPYLNIASNSAALGDFTTNGGFAIRGGSNFVVQYRLQNPYVYVLLGANVAPTDSASFNAQTNMFAGLYRNIRTNGGHVVRITMWPTVGLSMAAATNLTNISRWQMTNDLASGDEAIDSTVVITNAATQTSDGTHLDCTNNYLLAQYIGSQIIPSRSKGLNGLWRGNETVRALNFVGNYAALGGLTITGFRFGGNNIGVTFQTDNATFGEVDAFNEVTAAFLEYLVLGSSNVMFRGNNLQFGAVNGTGMRIVIGGTNNPTFSAMPGSLYINTNIGEMYIRTNASWLLK